MIVELIIITLYTNHLYVYNNLKAKWKLILIPSDLEAVVRRCSVKNVFLKVSQKSQENNCVRVSFLIKLQASDLQTFNFIKNETLAQVFSCELCEFFKSTIFHRKPTVAASGDTIS